ncbi:MAG: hypothetical protein ACSHX0_07400 [Akkermansiaceae bacterium]
MLRFIFLFLISLSSLHAGSADAVIKGQTSSGRTSVEILVQDMVGPINRVKLEIDGESYIITDAKETVIEDRKNGVYILLIESETAVFRMWMIPGTEKNIKTSDSSYECTFAAIIEATDPRKKHKWTLTPRITIGCKLIYSI